MTLLLIFLNIRASEGLISLTPALDFTQFLFLSIFRTTQVRCHFCFSWWWVTQIIQSQAFKIMELLTDRPKPTMSDRRAELEKKKAKLQAIREEKERRRREKELKDVKESTNRIHLGAGGDMRELDQMLSEVGVAPLSDVYSSLSSTLNSLTPEPSRNHTPDASLQMNSLPNK